VPRGSLSPSSARRQTTPAPSAEVVAAVLARAAVEVEVAAQRRRARVRPPTAASRPRTKRAGKTHGPVPRGVDRSRGPMPRGVGSNLGRVPRPTARRPTRTSSGTRVKGWPSRRPARWWREASRLYRPRPPRRRRRRPKRLNSSRRLRRHRRQQRPPRRARTPWRCPPAASHTRSADRPGTRKRMEPTVPFTCSPHRHQAPEPPASAGPDRERAFGPLSRSRDYILSLTSMPFGASVNWIPCAVPVSCITTPFWFFIAIAPAPAATAAPAAAAT
jgi:hypothetical protein